MPLGHLLKGLMLPFFLEGHEGLAKIWSNFMAAACYFNSLPSELRAERAVSMYGCHCESQTYVEPVNLITDEKINRCSSFWRNKTFTTENSAINTEDVYCMYPNRIGILIGTKWVETQTQTSHTHTHTYLSASGGNVWLTHAGLAGCREWQDEACESLPLDSLPTVRDILGVTLTNDRYFKRKGKHTHTHIFSLKEKKKPTCQLCTSKVETRNLLCHTTSISRKSNHNINLPCVLFTAASGTRA